MLYSGMSSLEIGGRLVFFTYSMNPVEAEAVAYAVIMQQRGIHFRLGFSVIVSIVTSIVLVSSQKKKTVTQPTQKVPVS